MPERSTLPCPCGRDAAYADCCGALHEGRATASTAEQLMRSRYTAFVVRNAAYLQQTWSSRTRPRTVEFTPNLHFTLNGEADSHHEHSTFTRENGSWVYVAALPI